MLAPRSSGRYPVHDRSHDSNEWIEVTILVLLVAAIVFAVAR
jgi:hypothetical protein